MNEKLIEFLKKLSTEDADNIWEWLDRNPLAISEMIHLITDSHPGLLSNTKEICQIYESKD